MNKNNCWLITHSHLLCFCDMVNAWFSTCLYSSRYLNKYPMYNFYQEVKNVLQAGRELVGVCKSNEYKVVKMCSSLVIVFYETWNKAQIFETLQEKLKEYITTFFYKLATRPICNTDAFRIHRTVEMLQTSRYKHEWKCKKDWEKVQQVRETGLKSPASLFRHSG